MPVTETSDGGQAQGEPPRYRSYLLRLWTVAGDSAPIWRASLEDAHTGERRGFADLAALTAFLAEQTDTAGRADAMDGEIGA